MVSRFLTPMAYLAGEEFMAFLGLFAAGHVQENAVGEVVLRYGVVAYAAGRDPADVVLDDQPEIELLSADNGTGRREGRPDRSLSAGWMRQTGPQT